MHNSIDTVRNYFKSALLNEVFTVDRNGGKTIELIGASFLADEPSIFGLPNSEYIDAEIKWYQSESTNINKLEEIYGKSPVAWQHSSNKYGEINSNYGYLVFGKRFGNQFELARNELLKNQDSRRAILIYTRPSIWQEFNENGKNDFICTNAQTFYIRNGRLDMVSQMRSNDAWAGYRNDYAWARHLQKRMVDELNQMTDDELTIGNLYWQVQSLHMYERNFYLVDAFSKGHEDLSKEEYKRLYPDSPYI